MELVQQSQDALALGQEIIDAVGLRAQPPFHVSQYRHALLEPCDVSL
jgi:hypothetical protein